MNFRTGPAAAAAVTAADYLWIRDHGSVFRHALEGGYTMTLVRGVTPAEVFRAMGAEQREACTGAAELADRQAALLDVDDYWSDDFLAGVFTVPGDGGDWAVVLHFDGGVGMEPEFLEALSAGSRAVSHTTNGGKPMDHFSWYEDGELRTGFEYPTSRWGSTPDALNDQLTQVGFSLVDDDDLVGGFTADVDGKAAVFALAERLTGVRLTEELLARSEYQVGEVPDDSDHTVMAQAWAEANAPIVVSGPGHR
ncbi:DUF6461 domain-containing protein [Streptomyces sp. NPDC087440]|uniref:DUF6461 domain-containing protein n=1 Tax=Streptomyces sp. NPDC087440 TaxID=3365790 RepID=UPI003801E98A